MHRAVLLATATSRLTPEAIMLTGDKLAPKKTEAEAVARNGRSGATPGAAQANGSAADADTSAIWSGAPSPRSSAT